MFDLTYHKTNYLNYGNHDLVMSMNKENKIKFINTFIGLHTPEKLDL